MRYLNLLLLTLLFACGNESTPPPAAEDPEANTEAAVTQTDEVAPVAEPPTTDASPATPTELAYQEALGSYVGFFNAKAYDEDRRPSFSNKITIFIEKIEDGRVEGRSVVAGNERPFLGTFQRIVDRDNWWSVQAKEPGDDRYDGAFHFTVDPNNNELFGTWEANRKLAVWERKFTLQKKDFHYNPQQPLAEDDWIWTDLYGTYDEEMGIMEMVTPNAGEYNASAQELSAPMVENMYKGDLEVMRNAIYARHGYSFKNRRMRYFFDNNVNWYMPVSTDIRDQLTALEKKNIELIKRYEEHATAYYDSFGR